MCDKHALTEASARISGSADMWEWFGGKTHYHLICKPAKPLF